MLTEHEAAVVEQVANGRTVREAAFSLGIGVSAAYQRIRDAKARNHALSLAHLVAITVSSEEVHLSLPS